MAEQHKKADGTQTANGDIPVVAPMNIGKGLLWDPVTKTYYVAIDDRSFEVDELGRLKLRVSALEDNQLKVRDDGIYQGNTARPDLFYQFVANHGNDSNPGTREAPLRTIQEAINRLENIPAYYFIMVHEGHTFDWVNNGEKPFAKIIFNVYGPTVDSTYPIATNTNAYYRGYTAKNFPRPTINVRVRDDVSSIKRQYLHCAELTMQGFRIEVYNKFEGYDDGSKIGHFNGFFHCEDALVIHGCILNEKTKGVPVGSGPGLYRSDVAFRTPVVRWIDSLCEVVPDLVASAFTTQIVIVSWNHDTLKGYGAAPDHEALIKSATWVQDMTRGWRNKIHGVVFDDATKSVFGMTLNWDIFANS